MSAHSFLAGFISLLFICAGWAVPRGDSLVLKAVSRLLWVSGLWQAAWAVLFLVDEPVLASWIARLGHLPIITLTLLYSDLVDAFFGRLSRFRPALLGVTCVLAALCFSPFLIAGVHRFDFGFYPRAGVLHPLLLVVCFVFVAERWGNELVPLFRKPKKSNTERLFLAAMVFYPLSSVDFLLNYERGIYPFGVLPLSVFLMLTLGVGLSQAYDSLAELNRTLEKKVRVATEAALIAERSQQAVERFAALGKVAAAMAHEIKNPIHFLIPTAKQLFSALRIFKQKRWQEDLQSAQGGAAEASCLDTMRDLEFLESASLESLGRIDRIVSSLNTFAKNTDIRREKVGIEQLLAQAIRVARSGRSSRQVGVELESVALQIQADTSALQQVFENLVVNAIDASQDGALIRVSCAAVAEGLSVDVDDQGHGIRPADREKLFDPFFSTKGVGKGSGLGLAIAREIVERHGGSLDVIDKSGPGARFRVMLPYGPELLTK